MNLFVIQLIYKCSKYVIICSYILPPVFQEMKLFVVTFIYQCFEICNYLYKQ